MDVDEFESHLGSVRYERSGEKTITLLKDGDFLNIFRGGDVAPEGTGMSDLLGIMALADTLYIWIPTGECEHYLTWCKYFGNRQVNALNRASLLMQCSHRTYKLQVETTSYHSSLDSRAYTQPLSCVDSAIIVVIIKQRTNSIRADLVLMVIAFFIILEVKAIAALP
ncbi:hypothetical protein GQ44DRAFT_701071 [Phaeosphaeriaceae sp. PMI808]|nr:hypothetical protein GQ44DRAFT_701071 [Phaeosphaeriaceae sp. PMI808]